MRLGHLGLSVWRRDGFRAGGAEILSMHTNTCGGRVEPGRGAHWQDKSPWAQTETQEILFKYKQKKKTKPFYCENGWTGEQVFQSAVSLLGALQNPAGRRQSVLFVPAVGEARGPGDPQRLLLTLTLLVRKEGLSKSNITFFLGSFNKRWTSSQ